MVIQMKQDLRYVANRDAYTEVLGELLAELEPS